MSPRPASLVQVDGLVSARSVGAATGRSTAVRSFAAGNECRSRPGSGYTNNAPAGLS